MTTNTTGNECSDCRITPNAERVGTYRRTAAIFTLVVSFKGTTTIHLCAKCAANRGF